MRTAAKQHFKINRPLATHWREAECREVDCPHYLQGWMTVVPTVSNQADYIRHNSGRHFTEARMAGELSEFTFAPGQRCFRPHKLPLDKQEIFTHEAGGIRRAHAQPLGWIEHFNEETDKTRRALERG